MNNPLWWLIQPRRRSRPASSPLIPTTAGFTLLELVIVVMVIGLLAAIAYPSFLNMRIKAQYSAARARLNEMGKNILEHSVFQGDYPGDVGRNTRPPKVEGEWFVAADMPFVSSTDYEHWAVGDDQCVVAITWDGQNQRRDAPVHVMPPATGQSPMTGDDIMFTVQRYACPGRGAGAIR